MQFENSICVLSLLLCGFVRGQQHVGEQSPAEQVQGAPEVALPACKYDVKSAEFTGPNAQFCRAFCYVDKRISADRLTATRSLAAVRAAQMLTDGLDKTLESSKSITDASRKLKTDLISKLEGFQKRIDYLEKEIKKNEQLIAQYQGDLKSLKDLSKTPKYNNPLNPRGSLDDNNLKNYRLHITMSSRFAKKNRDHRDEIHFLKNELIFFKNFLDALAPGNASKDIIESVRSLEINIEHLSKPGEAKFFKLNGKSISLSRQPGTTEIDRIDFKNSDTGRYDLACDYLGTNIVDVAKLKEEPPCDLAIAWNQASPNTELTISDDTTKRRMVDEIESALQKPLDEATAKELVGRDSSFYEAVRRVAQQKASEDSKNYESRYLAELKKGRIPSFIKFYDYRTDYKEFIKDPANWPEIAEKGRELREEKVRREIYDDIEERYKKGEKIPEVEVATDEIFFEGVTYALRLSNLMHQRALTNRKRFEELLKSAQEPGPIRLTVQDYALIFDPPLTPDSEVTITPKLSFYYDSPRSQIKLRPFLLKKYESIEYAMWIDGVNPPMTFSLSSQENKEFATWISNNLSTMQNLDSIPLSEARKVELCKALKSAL